ncbi:Uncharacterised protein [uncultured archaeon]|nr:Uncharacterised protein [uncultured archaeon]
MDEIAFKAKYKEWNYAERLQVNEGAKTEEVLLFLAKAREAASAKAFQLSGVDLGKVSSEAKKLAGNLPPGCHSIANALSSVKQAQLKALFASAVKDENLAPLAEAYFYNSLLDELQFDFSVSEDAVKRAFPGVEEAKTGVAGITDGDAIVFAAKYGEWISIKKMSIDEKTQYYEVMAMLASVRETIDRKFFQLAGVAVDGIDARVAVLAKGRRKALGTLVEIFASMDAQETKAFLASSVPNPKAEPFAEAYFFKTLYGTLGFNFEVNVETLKKIFPDLKMPMPKGRKPKK